MTAIGPIAPEERINSLDTPRGFALLGILPANVLVFGMFLAAANDPTFCGLLISAMWLGEVLFGNLGDTPSRECTDAPFSRIPVVRWSFICGALAFSALSGFYTAHRTGNWWSRFAWPFGAD
jgi:hypothetical protein